MTEISKHIGITGIVIPTVGDRPQWLKSCVESVLQQIETPVHLVIVTLNPDLVEPIVSPFDVTLIRQENRGLSAAINLGLSHLTECEFVGWIGDDDLFSVGSIEKSVKFLSAHPNVVATYGQVKYIDADGQEIFTTNTGSLASYYLKWGKDLVPQPGSVFRRSAFETLGPLDTNLRFAMDLEWFLRMKTIGKLGFIKSELASFRLHQSSITGSNHQYSEADVVREKYRSGFENQLARSLRIPIRILDKALYRLLRK